MPEQIICNGDCVVGQDYTPEENTSVVLKYPDGEVTTSVPISFTVEEEQVPEESYLHTWSLPGAETFNLDLVMLPDTNYGPTVFGYEYTFTSATARNALGQEVSLPMPASYSISATLDVNGNPVSWANFNNGSTLVIPSGTAISISLSVVLSEACTGDTQWVSPEPVSSYTIEEVANTESINGLPDVEYFPNLNEVTIEWNGYTYTTTEPPVRYLLYDLYAHGLVFSQFDPAYAQMVATLDPNSTDYTTFQDSRGTIVVFHKAIDYARGGWGYTKDTTTLDSLQISAGATIPPDGICRLNVPLVGAPTLFFDFPDSDPSSGSTFNCPSMSNPRYGSWAYFVYDSTGLVQFEYRITSRSSSLPDFTPVTITANPEIIVDWGNGDIDYLTGSSYTITKEQTIGGWWLQSYDYSQLFSGTVCRETPYLRLLGYDPYLNQCLFLTMSSNNIEDKYYDFELLRQSIAEEGDVWNYYYEPLLLPDASFYTIYSPTNYRYYSACQFWSYFLYPQNTGSLGAQSDRVGFFDSKTEVPLSELNNFEDKTYVDAKFTYVTRAYTVVETDTGDISERYDEVFDGNAVAPDPTVSLGNGYALTFLPQGQTFTFGAECEPTNVVINQEDPNAPMTTAYKLTVFKEGTLVVEKTYETDPTPLISIVTNSIKYILKIFGTDLEGNEIEEEYSFTNYDPIQDAEKFNIVRLPYTELKVSSGACDVTVTTPSYTEFSCKTTSEYSSSNGVVGPVNAITIQDKTDSSWDVYYFDVNGDIVATENYAQKPIIEGNGLSFNDYVLATDPISSTQYVIPNPMTVGGIAPTETLLPGAEVVIEGKTYVVEGRTETLTTPGTTFPETITYNPQEISGSFEFDFGTYESVDFITPDQTYYVGTSIPGQTYTLTSPETGTSLVIDIPGFDPNFSFSFGEEPVEEPNNRPVIKLDNANFIYCNCPDATKQRVYNSEGSRPFVQDWSASNAGAPTILGLTCCKHVYSVLMANELEKPFVPVDMPTSIVDSNSDRFTGWIGDQDDNALYDFLIDKEGLNMPKKGRDQFFG